MKRFLTALIIIPAVLLSVQGFSCAAIFSDNFNSENGGVPDALNYNSFANWTVSNGTVDLIGKGGTWDFYPGNGLYVDLDGSTGQAGIFTSKMTFGPGTYSLQFDLGGSQRGGTETVDVSIGNWNYTFSNIPSDFPLTTETFLVNTTGGQLTFYDHSWDNIGAILDNVQVDDPPSTVPEPYSMILYGLGLVGFATYRWKFMKG